ncbi:MAG TPA: phosphatase PAP2 family protein [Nocardioidaceae bacterium]|nr:phosphatase PAP2 family protein [Nocardioidaceae bacterium]
MFARRSDEPDDGWTSAVSSGFALAGFLALVLVAFTLLAMGPFVRYDAYFNLDPPPQEWVSFLHVLDRVGQRAVALPILGGALFWIYRQTRSWRPVVVAGLAVFMLNLVVLILKLTLGRSQPITGDPSFFTGGMAYPSGHSSNIVLVYGLVAYLVSRYTSPSRRTRVLMWGTVALLAVTMVVTSLTLNWHWFADLVAGLLVGGIVLELTATVDRMLPAHVFAAGGLGGLRAVLDDVLRMFRPHRPQGPTGSA